MAEVADMIKLMEQLVASQKTEKKEDVAPIDEDKAEAARRTLNSARFPTRRMLQVCPGHSLDRRILDGARRSFAALDGDDFLYTARKVAYKAARFNTNPHAALGDGSPEFLMYEKMMSAGDWAGADKTYLDWLKARDPVRYLETLSLEGLAREFNRNHSRRVYESPFFVRWMDMEELASYLDGTFESRTEEDGGRRGYKALSLGENIHANKRPASLEVPADDTIRGAIRPATYTVLPRFVPPEDERFDHQKHLSYAHETECRLPDGTRVPRGARIRIKRSMVDPAPGSRHMDVLEQLRGMMEVDFI